MTVKKVNDQQRVSPTMSKPHIVDDLTVVAEGGRYYKVLGERIQLSESTLYTVSEVDTNHKYSLRIFSNRIHPATIGNIRKNIPKNLTNEHLLYPLDLIKDNQGYGKGKIGYIFEKLDSQAVSINQLFNGSVTLSLSEKIKLMIQLCETINFLHEQGLAYKLFAKENLRINPEKVKLILINNDAISDSTYNPQKYDKGHVFARYTAPEVLMGNPFNVLSDYYAVATLISMVIYNVHPIDGFRSDEATGLKRQQQIDYFYKEHPTFIFTAPQHTFYNRVSQEAKLLWKLAHIIREKQLGELI